MQTIRRVKAEKVFDFCVSALKHVGAREEEAKIVAENLTLANLRGIDSHGVVRLPAYIKRVIKGLINPLGPIETVKDQGSIALIDAHNNFGQVAAMQAVSLAAKKAKYYGVATVGVRKSNHFGIAAHYAMKLTEQKLIGIILSNTPPAIAPWGGKIPMFGTNPVCVGFPIDENESIILDMALSVVARGKIRLADLKGEKIPNGWAFDENGNPTNDPKEAIKGSLAPVGGPKGYGLALVVDLFCGLLIGSNYGRDVKELNDFSGPSGTGFFIEAINIEHFRPYQEYKNLITNYIMDIKRCPRREGVEEIFLPGEIERKETEVRKKLGIPLDEQTFLLLKNLAMELGIPFQF